MKNVSANFMNETLWKWCWSSVPCSRAPAAPCAREGKGAVAWSSAPAGGDEGWGLRLGVLVQLAAARAIEVDRVAAEGLWGVVCCRPITEMTCFPP